MIQALKNYDLEKRGRHFFGFFDRDKRVANAVKTCERIDSKHGLSQFLMQEAQDNQAKLKLNVKKPMNSADGYVLLEGNNQYVDIITEHHQRLGARR